MIQKILCHPVSPPFNEIKVKILNTKMRNLIYGKEEEEKLKVELEPISLLENGFMNTGWF